MVAAIQREASGGDDTRFLRNAVLFCSKGEGEGESPRVKKEIIAEPGVPRVSCTAPFLMINIFLKSKFGFVTVIYCHFMSLSTEIL